MTTGSGAGAGGGAGAGAGAGSGAGIGASSGARASAVLVGADGGTEVEGPACPLPRVELSDLLHLGTAACVVDIGSVTSAQHAALARSVHPVRCLHCPERKLMWPYNAATGAGSGDGGGSGADRGSSGQVEVARRPFGRVHGLLGTKDYQRHIEESTPQLWAVKGLCLALCHAGGMLPEHIESLQRVSSMLMRGGFSCLCYVQAPDTLLVHQSQGSSNSSSSHR